MDSGKPAYFDNLSVEGWFWDLVRGDGRFRERFGQIEQAVQAYAASRLSPEEYMRALKSYLAHLRRYGLRTVSLPGPEVPGRPLRSGSHLLLPLPGKGQLLAVPKPDVAYADLGEGLKPVPLRDGPAQDLVQSCTDQEAAHEIRPSRKSKDTGRTRIGKKAAGRQKPGKAAVSAGQAGPEDKVH